MVQDEMIKVFRYQNKINDMTWNNILRAINKRHSSDFDWFYEKRNWNGKKIKYISVECMLWIEQVYFREEKDYLCAEINFSLSRLHKKLSSDEVSTLLVYTKMKASDLAEYFNSKKGNVYYEIKKIDSSFKQTEKNRIVITADGVKYLEQNIFKKSYWQRLEEKRLWLKEVEKEKSDLK